MKAIHLVGIGVETTPFQTYMAARAIADLAYEFATPDVSRDDFETPWLNDRRDESVNPFHSQTKRGLFLEIYYGQPGKIWTPWGQWGCWGSGSGSWTEKMPKLLERLGAAIFREEIINSMGHFGPIYAVHRVDDLVLPIPEVRERNQYLPYKQAELEWENLTKYYCNLRGEQPPVSVLQKFALDDIILEARGKQEPKSTKDDVCDLAGLVAYAGQVVKYTKDGGKKWRYARLYPSMEHFQSGSYGIATNEEVLPNTQVHCRGSLTDRDFRAGLLVRPATCEEIKGIAFSYD